jgi:N-methylhydantoinase A
VPADVEALFAEMEGEGRALLVAEGFAAADMRLERLIDIRYVGQVRALTLPAGDGPFDEAVLEDVAARFHAAYEREFKYAVPELPVELRSVRLAAVGVTAKPSFGGADAGGDAPAGDAEAARVGEQDVAWAEGGARPTPFYDRAKLAPGATFSGPAIVEQYDSTTIVPPRTEVEVDGNGNLVLRVEA